VLGDTHTIADTTGPGTCVYPGGIGQVGLGYTRDFLHIGRCIFGNDFFELFETLGPFFHKRVVIKIFIDDDIHHPVDPGHIGPQLLPQPVIGKRGNLDKSRINDDELGASECDRSFYEGG